MTREIPAATSEAVSKSMRSNKGSGTRPELAVRRMLRESGFPGYRLNWRRAPGRPDIAYPGRKVAIFVNGCFWHMCPYCDLRPPGTHQEYWIPKLRRNRERDEGVRRALTELGWTVVTVWECELKDPDAVKGRLLEALSDPSEH